MYFAQRNLQLLNQICSSRLPSSHFYFSRIVIERNHESHLCFEEGGHNCPLVKYLSTNGKKLVTGLV